MRKIINLMIIILIIIFLLSSCIKGVKIKASPKMTITLFATRVDMTSTFNELGENLSSSMNATFSYNKEVGAYAVSFATETGLSTSLFNQTLSSKIEETKINQSIYIPGLRNISNITIDVPEISNPEDINFNINAVDTSAITDQTISISTISEKGVTNKASIGEIEISKINLEMNWSSIEIPAVSSTINQSIPLSFTGFDVIKFSSNSSLKIDLLNETSNEITAQATLETENGVKITSSSVTISSNATGTLEINLDDKELTDQATIILGLDLTPETDATVTVDNIYFSSTSKVVSAKKVIFDEQTVEATNTVSIGSITGSFDKVTLNGTVIIDVQIPSSWESVRATYTFIATPIVNNNEKSEAVIKRIFYSTDLPVEIPLEISINKGENLDYDIDFISKFDSSTDGATLDFTSDVTFDATVNLCIRKVENIVVDYEKTFQIPPNVQKAILNSGIISVEISSAKFNTIQATLITGNKEYAFDINNEGDSILNLSNKEIFGGSATITIDKATIEFLSDFKGGQITVSPTINELKIKEVQVEINEKKFVNIPDDVYELTFSSDAKIFIEINKGKFKSETDMYIFNGSENINYDISNEGSIIFDLNGKNFWGTENATVVVDSVYLSFENQPLSLDENNALTIKTILDLKIKKAKLININKKQPISIPDNIEYITFKSGYISVNLNEAYFLDDQDFVDVELDLGDNNTHKFFIDEGELKLDLSELTIDRSKGATIIINKVYIEAQNFITSGGNITAQSTINEIKIKEAKIKQGDLDISKTITISKNNFGDFGEIVDEASFEATMNLVWDMPPLGTNIKLKIHSDQISELNDKVISLTPDSTNKQIYLGTIQIDPDSNENIVISINASPENYDENGYLVLNNPQVNLDSTVTFLSTANVSEIKLKSIKLKSGSFSSNIIKDPIDMSNMLKVSMAGTTIDLGKNVEMNDISFTINTFATGVTLDATLSILATYLENETEKSTRIEIPFSNEEVDLSDFLSEIFNKFPKNLTMGYKFDIEKASEIIADQMQIIANVNLVLPLKFKVKNNIEIINYNLKSDLLGRKSQKDYEELLKILSSIKLIFDYKNYLGIPLSVSLNNQEYKFIKRIILSSNTSRKSILELNEEDISLIRSKYPFTSNIAVYIPKDSIIQIRGDNSHKIYFDLKLSSLVQLQF